MGEYEGITEGEWAKDTYEVRGQYPKIVELEKFCMSSIGQDICLMAFDNHVIVTVTREGIDTEEFDHD